MISSQHHDMPITKKKITTEKQKKIKINSKTQWGNFKIWN